MGLKSWLKTGHRTRHHNLLTHHQEQQTRYLRNLKRRRRSLRIENLEDRTLPTIQLTPGVPVWAEQGPGPITQAQLTVPPDNRAAGAIAEVAIGPDHQL